MKVELTPDKLAKLRQKAEAAEGVAPSPWTFSHTSGEYRFFYEVRDSDDYQVVYDMSVEEGEHIAAADPATVLALIEEIERLRAGLKDPCPHWPISEDGHEWVRGCTLQEYQIPDGGEPSEFCPDCGGLIEIEEFQPNNESEAGQ